MNLYELIDDLYHAHSYLRAGDDKEWPYMPVRQMLDAYAELAPDWANAPEWAQWYAIDWNGEAVWCRDEPTVKERWAAMWGPITVRLQNAPFVSIPLGIDWRLCKWQRPEVVK